MNKKDLIKSIQNSDGAAFDSLVAEAGKASLETASFKGAHVGCMRLHTVNLANTEWEACIFDGTTFDGVDLSGAFFNSCTFHDCVFLRIADFSDAAFDGCVWQKSGIEEPQCDLDGVEMTNCQLKDCTLKNLHFSESTLQSLTFNGGRIENVNGDAEMKSVTLRSVEIENFDTSEMSLSNCTASSCKKLPEGFRACEGCRRRV